MPIKDFIEEEIMRIEKFIQPMTVTFAAPTRVISSWSAETYRVMAFERIKEGRNYPIAQVLEGAEKLLKSQSSNKNSIKNGLSGNNSTIYLIKRVI